MCNQEKCIHAEYAKIIFEKGLDALPEGANTFVVLETLASICVNIVDWQKFDKELALKEFVTMFNDCIESYRASLEQ